MIRAALWFIGLFALAATVALLAGRNDGMVSLFWAPYRIDLSLNMVLLLAAALFMLLHGALRGLALLGSMPAQARLWRQQQKERALYHTLIECLAHLHAGRFVRSRKAAHTMLALCDELRDALPQAASLSAIAHQIIADSAHALQDHPTRDSHHAQVLHHASAQGNSLALQIREGAQMRAARWALDDRDPQEALARLALLPQGASRRTQALRIRLKAARLAHDTQSALDTARLIAKHGGFSPQAARSIIRSLLTEKIRQVRDPAQLQQLWDSMSQTEQTDPDLAIAAAQKLLELHNDSATARNWLLPIWQTYTNTNVSPTTGSNNGTSGLTPTQADRLFTTLQRSLEGLDADWLARIENAQRAAPRDARLQYLAGMACLQRQLWGKAGQLLTQASGHLSNATLRASAWKAIALLAEQHEDPATAARAWREAALSTMPN